MTENEPTVIARTVVRIVVPIILVTAITLLLQGHNAPGGGFIGGVLTAVAFALIYIIYGLDYFETEILGRTALPRALPGEPVEDETQQRPGVTKEFSEVLAIGLAIAAGGGIAAIALGYPFLSQAVAFVEGIPLFHEIEVASALVFDLGVYFVVVGGLLTIVAVVGAE
ncbi:MnhB domain-containing protein [Halapricum hydrolyticum]|uniref:Sodium:proton antiporter n=1 Tax=Halapricum hydrolyticum TaxID=2979991 RepID=A0AAE3LED4_9EURY|nr:MnhB domain-containing protein [Halapricum hydrolyticum]MCU4716545.1 sodium:proton antiporter [Halapricum hydrolyticum]MCU4725850.1 sodium:proton antiporter [Halapricum hydrolyticum]